MKRRGKFQSQRASSVVWGLEWEAGALKNRPCLYSFRRSIALSRCMCVDGCKFSSFNHLCPFSSATCLCVCHPAKHHKDLHSILSLSFLLFLSSLDPLVGNSFYVISISPLFLLFLPYKDKGYLLTHESASLCQASRVMFFQILDFTLSSPTQWHANVKQRPSLFWSSRVEKQEDQRSFHEQKQSFHRFMPAWILAFNGVKKRMRGKKEKKSAKIGHHCLRVN